MLLLYISIFDASKVSIWVNLFPLLLILSYFSSVFDFLGNSIILLSFLSISSFLYSKVFAKDAVNSLKNLLLMIILSFLYNLILLI